MKGMPAVDLWNYVFSNFIEIENKQPIEYDRKGNPMPVVNDHKKMIDFDKDAEYIFASFRQAYGMNLFYEQGSLYWNEFQSLLRSEEHTSELHSRGHLVCRLLL